MKTSTAMRAHAVSLPTAFAALLLLLVAVPAPAQAAEHRAIWITRYDYRTADDVRDIVKRCASLGVSHLLFQVRGNADAFYRSALEPWARELGGEDPGFDPLALAVAEAHGRGLTIEAWINVMPLWKGTRSPADHGHPLVRHPEWLVVGSDGKPQALNEHYVCANPARPDVRAHLAAVAADIATRYAVDGVHLDYIRYVTDLEKQLDFSFDPVTLKAFGGDPSESPERWRRFKVAQVTEVVRAIRAAVTEARPDCQLTAAVYPTHESRQRVFQDVEAWIREELIDAVYPMLYSDDDAQYLTRLTETMERLGSTVREGTGAGSVGVPIYPAVGVFKHPDGAMSRRQIEAVRSAKAPGLALFCYASFFPSRDQRQLKEERSERQTERVSLVRALFAGPPAEESAPDGR